MIIYANDNNRFTGDFLSVKRESKIWHIVYTQAAGTEQQREWTFDFNADAIQFAPDMAHLGLGGYGLFLFWASESAGDKSGVKSATHRNGMTEKMHHIGSFFICADKSVHFLSRVTLVDMDDSAGDVVQVKYAGCRRVGDVFAACIPEAAEYVQRHHAKIKLLGHINTNDSLAMLEAQLDMLTTAFLARIPEEERTETEKALAAAVAESSTLSLHSLEKLCSTISNQKSHIRKEQRLYFDSRGSSVNNDPAS